MLRVTGERPRDEEKGVRENALRGLCEFGNFYRAGGGKAMAMQLDALNLMKRFSREITLAAIRATHHWDILDYQ